MNSNIPPYIEQSFRWIRETISLIYSHHKHPLPMVAMIFMYAETLGKPLTPKKGRTAEKKVSTFIKEYLPNLWDAFSFSYKREQILGNYYRNGLVHQMFMKMNCGIHEGGTEYVSQKIQNVPFSINIDMLFPEFINGLSLYYKKLISDSFFLGSFKTEMEDFPNQFMDNDGS